MADGLVYGGVAAKDSGEVLRPEHSLFNGVGIEGSSGKSSVASLFSMRDGRLTPSVDSSVESETDVVIRDPEAMLKGLITCGLTPLDGARVLVEYYKAKAVKVDQPDVVSLSSRKTTRDLRVQKWREDMEALPQEYGYCYLNVVRYSHRPHLKKALGQAPTIQGFISLLRYDDIDLDAAHTYNVYRFPGRARFQPCYHVARECDKGDVVGSFHQVLVSMLRLYPFLNSMQLESSESGIGDLPLVGNVGLVPGALDGETAGSIESRQEDVSLSRQQWRLLDEQRERDRIRRMLSDLQRNIESQSVVEHASPDLPLLFTELPLNRSPEYTAIEDTGDDNEELGSVSLDTNNFHFNMEYSLSHLCSEGYMDICQDFAIFEHIPMNVRTYNRLDSCEPLGNGIHMLVFSPLSMGWLMDDERERQAKWPLALIVAPDLFQGLCKQLSGVGPVTVLNHSGWLESDIQRTLSDIGYSPMAVNTLNVNIGCVYHTLHEEYQYTVTDLDEYNIINGVIYRYTQISFDERGYYVPYTVDLHD